MSSAVRGRISALTKESKSCVINGALQGLWAAFLSLLIAGPWLTGGYIFGTDWPGPRRFDFPTAVVSWAPVEWALAVGSRVASGEWTAKLFVLGLLFTAALTAFRAVPTVGFVPGAVASVLYLFNPFVFGRLHFGQMFVLAGYALLPWVAVRSRTLLLRPTWTASLVLAVSLVAVGITSTHMFVIAAAIVAALVLSQAIGARERLVYLRQVGPGFALAVVVTVAASSFWLIPLAFGQGPIAKTVAGITSTDLTAYAAVPDGNLGLVPNLIGLYGFWGEDTGRFTSMKAFVPGWPIVLALLLGVAAIGSVWAFRQRRNHVEAWVVGLLIAAVIALVLEAGVSSSVTRGLVTWLDDTLPVYRGMRDAGKWAAMLALGYSQLVGLGTDAILRWIRVRGWVGERKEWTGAVAAGLLLAIPLFYGNGLLFGMHGEIQPSEYPSGWYSADKALLADSHPGRTLFLPWHEYMTYSFVRNQNQVVVSPASTFFSTPVVVNTDPELPGNAPSTDPDQVAISDLVKLGDQGRWAEVLASRNIRYVLLAREVDWKSYDFLNRQPNMTLVGDYGSIVLYRNNLVA